MSALQDISKLLGEWLEFTEAETAAIQSSAWLSLREIQKAKSGLQTSITAALGEAGEGGQKRHRLRPRGPSLPGGSQPAHFAGGAQQPVVVREIYRSAK